MKYIKIKNARENNLKDVSIEIPRNQIVVFTGVSGSGKSSLVFETINAQAKRELYDILGTYAQSRLPKISKPDCDSIENLSPSIVLKQKRNLSNSRSTVGTATEIYTYLRLLFSRIGKPFIGPSTYFSFNSIDGMCLNCNGTGLIQDIDLEKLIDKTKSLNDGAILFPDFKVNSWQWKYIAHTGFFDRDLPLNQYSKSDFEKLLYGKESNIQIDSGEFGLSMNYEGLVNKINKLYINKNQDSLSSKKKQKIQAFLSIKNCNSCNGARLNQRALQVMINKHNIDTISHLQISNLKAFISEVMEPSAKIIIEKIKQKAQNLIDIGLGYLSLSRNTSTLSGGEYQRVKLATQLDSSLTEMIYILDEPSVGLHPKDVYQLNHLIKILKEKGNSLLIVEHDPDVIKIADHIVDIGPLAGVYGGRVVFEGSYQELLKSKSVTALELNKKTSLKSKVRKSESFFEIYNANSHNLKNINVKIPKKLLCCITGVAGSGKSSLIHKDFIAKYPNAIVIDQKPIGQSNRSNLVTYSGLFDDIRKIYSDENNISTSFFSFNSKGACNKCNGSGFVEIEMAFLEPIKTVCDKCKGKRYQESVLQYKYKNKNIAELLSLSIDQTINLFEDKTILQKITMLQKVGLGYLSIGQALSTLSGGECQRIKLSSELYKKGNIYILDEPTTGLHMQDIQKIIDILNELVDNGNSVIVIEHNLEVITQADWIIDIGPESGEYGGKVVFEGTSQELVHFPKSYTGQYLKNYIQ